MSCRPTYDPCLNGKLNQIGSYAAAARYSAEQSAISASSAATSAEEAAQSAEAAQLVPSGGGLDKLFYENDIVMTTNYTITSGKNAMSAGPITVNPGVVLTVPAGSVYTII
jgi:hypothetical protein